MTIPEIMPPLPSFATQSMLNYKRTLLLIEGAIFKCGEPRTENLPPVLGLLLIVIGDQEVQPKDLAREFPLSSNIYQPVSRLIGLDLAIQQDDEVDKRRVWIKLNDRGLRLCAAIRHEIAKNHALETTTKATP